MGSKEGRVDLSGVGNPFDVFFLRTNGIALLER
jgi:hypothetical protein